jgi:hypothetical protein
MLSRIAHIPLWSAMLATLASPLFAIAPQQPESDEPRTTQSTASQSPASQNTESRNASQAAEAVTTDIYQQQVRPLLEKHCLECHGAEEQGGGLRLDSLDSMLHGGDSGKAIEQNSESTSLLIQRVTSADANERMPPEGAGLAPTEIAILKKWITDGAKGHDVQPAEDGAWLERLNHWAWKPMVYHPAPDATAIQPLPASIGDAQSPIDAWVRARLAKENVLPSPAAEKAALLRRVYFDLIGLPPSQAELQAFLADDDPNSFGKVVDRLLASPRYGERWARHWLDVVHYGDTHGYDKDKPRPNAWPYRDYVIRAWNDDRPYSQFIQQQVAGDTLPVDAAAMNRVADNIEALGFIAAGPWDFIGHAEVPETKTDGKIARHLDRDNMVATTLGTFNSLTVHCAQCHNHKFDPFTQADYYALQAVFAAIDRTEKTYYADPAILQKTTVLQAELDSIHQQMDTNRAAIQAASGDLLTPLQQKVAGLTEPLRQGLPVEYGFHSQIANQPLTTKWVQIDLGVAVEVNQLRLHPCYDDFNSIGAGFGFPVRWKVVGSNDPTFTKSVLLAKYDEQDYENPGWSPINVDCGHLPAQVRTVRYLRIEAVQLAKRAEDYIFALAECEVFDSQHTNVALGKEVTYLDSIEAGPRWGAKNLVDGKTPTRESADQLAQLHHDMVELLNKSVPSSLRQRTQSLLHEETRIRAEIAALPPPQKVFAGTVHSGSGAFKGTGADGGKPRRIYLLARGNVSQPGREVPPAALSGKFGLPDFFQLPSQHKESERRAALAKWLIHTEHPLTWRSMANRLWQYHFGRGIVDTPNDFGRMGGTPTHPELLEFLAIELRDSQSIKKLQREIVMSATYQQSSVVANPLASSIDAQNVLLWQQNRRKLEAEAVRDAVLAASGSLDLRMGGEGYQDFVIEHPEHSPHYEYDLADPSDSRTFRRSVYRFIVRSQLQPFMTLLDCADPSIRVDRRNETVSATQALTMLNNGFMLEQSKRFAARLRFELPAGSDEALAHRAFLLGVGRDGTNDEIETLAQYARQFGWENACRVVLNLNEFSFVD